ncbi:MAG: hypothetical protein AAGI72_02115 [Pseudomonadota bacterium]
MKKIKEAGFCLALIAAFTLSSPASATPVFSFIIDGDTAFLPFSISNQSDAGERVTRFNLDITSTGSCFDVTNFSNDGCPGNAANGAGSFAAVGGTDSTTGLVSPSVADGDTVLDLVFTDFDPGETFSWNLDVDGVNAGAFGTITGDDLIGAAAFIDFSNGQRLLGSLLAVPGNPDASSFTVSGVVDIPPDGDVPLPSTLVLLVAGFFLGRLGSGQSTLPIPLPTARS